MHLDQLYFAFILISVLSWLSLLIVAITAMLDTLLLFVFGAFRYLTPIKIISKVADHVPVSLDPPFLLDESFMVRHIHTYHLDLAGLPVNSLLLRHLLHVGNVSCL